MTLLVPRVANIPFRDQGNQRTSQVPRNVNASLLSYGSSLTSPRHYNGAPSPNDRPIALVGKGITFDSGGISLKPGAVRRYTQPLD